MIPHYQEKFDYLYTHQSGMCAIAHDNGRLAAINTDGSLHHAGVHNTKPNRARFPLLLNSTWNLVAVNHLWHMRYPSWGKISLLEADRRETFLRDAGYTEDKWDTIPQLIESYEVVDDD